MNGDFDSPNIQIIPELAERCNFTVAVRLVQLTDTIRLEVHGLRGEGDEVRMDQVTIELFDLNHDTLQIEVHHKYVFITPTPIITAVFTSIPISAGSTRLTIFVPTRVSDGISTFA